MKPTPGQIKIHARRYPKVVEWSDEDGVYVGSAPPIIGRCCHGATEAEVLAELAVIVDEWVEVFCARASRCRRRPPARATAENFWCGFRRRFIKKRRSRLRPEGKASINLSPRPSPTPRRA